MDNIANKIRELREMRSWSQNKLAIKIGVHRNLISLWENGNFEPSIYNCIRLADAFGVTLDELCCRGDLNV